MSSRCRKCYALTRKSRKCYTTCLATENSRIAIDHRLSFGIGRRTTADMLYEKRRSATRPPLLALHVRSIWRDLPSTAAA